MLYQSIQPETQKDTYNPGDQIDFLLTFENMKLLLNTLRFEGVVNVTQDGNPINTDDIKFDHLTGIHNFIDQITVETQNQGLIENLTEYPRYVRMISDCTMNNDQTFSSKHTPELRVADECLAQSMCVPINPYGLTTTNTEVSNSKDFSSKLFFCLNNAYMDPAKPDPAQLQLSYKRSGAVRITITLNTVFKALYGDDCDTDTSFNLTDLVFSYQTVDDDGKNVPVFLRSKINIRQNIQSKLSSISTKVPAAACTSVAMSFQPQSDYNQDDVNNQSTATLPDLNEVVFTWNDASNRYITFPLRDRSEMLLHYLKSLGSSGVNNVTLNNLKNNNSFGLGAELGLPVDLRNQKFNVMIDCDNVSSTDPYLVYLYFNNLISI